MADLVTNADDVDVYLKANSEDIANTADVPTSAMYIVGNEFSLSTEQDIESVGGFSQNVPKGLTKGDIEYSFDFSIDGENRDVQLLISDEDGDSRPFSMTVEKPNEANPDETEWKYSFEVCLADTEEISGTTGEAIGLSVEGMAAGRTRTL